MFEYFRSISFSLSVEHLREGSLFTNISSTFDKSYIKTHKNSFSKIITLVKVDLIKPEIDKYELKFFMYY